MSIEEVLGISVVKKKKTTRFYEWDNRIVKTGELDPVPYPTPGSVSLCHVTDSLTLTIQLHYPNKNPNRAQIQGFTYLLVDH